MPLLAKRHRTCSEPGSILLTSWSSSRRGCARRFRRRSESRGDAAIDSDGNLALAEFYFDCLGHCAVRTEAASRVLEIAELQKRLAQIAEGLVMPDLVERLLVHVAEDVLAGVIRDALVHLAVVRHRHALPRDRALIERIVLDLALFEVADLIGDEIHAVGDSVEDFLEPHRVVFDDAEDRLDGDERLAGRACVAYFTQHLDARDRLF